MRVEIYARGTRKPRTRNAELPWGLLMKAPSMKALVDASTLALSTQQCSSCYMCVMERKGAATTML